MLLINVTVQTILMGFIFPVSKIALSYLWAYRLFLVVLLKYIVFNDDMAKTSLWYLVSTSHKKK